MLVGGIGSAGCYELRIGPGLRRLSIDRKFSVLFGEGASGRLDIGTVRWLRIGEGRQRVFTAYIPSHRKQCPGSSASVSSQVHLAADSRFGYDWRRAEGETVRESKNATSVGERVGERRVRSTEEWLAYFQQNALQQREIPWQSNGVGAAPAEMAPLRRSLQAWQLGETSDGRHLAASADRFAAATNDPAYRDVIELFIREEQRHGALLGRILDDAGIPRREADWGDTLFRRLRYSITDIEVWTTPVVMVEVLAMVYYNAIRRATGSPVLRAVCAQILADEVPHVRLQCERLAVLLRNRSRTRFRCTMAVHRALFLAVMLLVWVGHHRALRAGGYTWTHYRRAAYAKMNRAWRRMDPQCYVWT